MEFLTNFFNKRKQHLDTDNKGLSSEERLLLYQKYQLILESKKKLKEKQNGIPLVAARNKLISTVTEFELKRDKLNSLWEQAYKDFSWWNKLKYDEKLDLSSLDSQISQLRSALSDFDKRYGSQCLKLQSHFLKVSVLSEARITEAHKKLLSAIDIGLVKSINDTSLMSAWLATLSVPISISDDLMSANQVFDSLRSINRNYENMSNSEIWWETVWMSPESHRGLVSLAKGAYFEQIIADSTGGQLHEHFNNPNTDIVIDGVEMQLKATERVGYINSVDDDIPVITTSEVAIKTDSIDSGYSNDELNTTVELALGGTVIDAKDTAIDAILTGAGSLGIFATINGINHAAERYDQGVDSIEAILAGAGLAIEGTAKGLVDASELVYNAANSRPSRFIGRTMKKMLIKLDNWIFDVDKNKSEKE